MSVCGASMPKRLSWSVSVCRANIPEEFLEEVSAVGERIDGVVQEEALLMKVDVEGLEPAVMASAQGLLRTYK